MSTFSVFLEKLYDWGYASLQQISGGDQVLYMLWNLALFVILLPGLTLLFLVFWYRTRAKNRASLEHD